MNVLSEVNGRKRERNREKQSDSDKKATKCLKEERFAIGYGSLNFNPLEKGNTRFFL